jgi:hypothetical protein
MYLGQRDDVATPLGTSLRLALAETRQGLVGPRRPMLAAWSACRGVTVPGAWGQTPRSCGSLAERRAA